MVKRFCRINFHAHTSTNIYSQEHMQTFPAKTVETLQHLATRQLFGCLCVCVSLDWKLTRGPRLFMQARAKLKYKENLQVFNKFDLIWLLLKTYVSYFAFHPILIYFCFSFALLIFFCQILLCIFWLYVCVCMYIKCFANYCLPAKL